MRKTNPVLSLLVRDRQIKQALNQQRELENERNAIFERFMGQFLAEFNKPNTNCESHNLRILQHDQNSRCTRPKSNPKLLPITFCIFA